MAGTAALKSVKEVKSTIKGLEHNAQTSGKGAGGTESNANINPKTRTIGSK